MDERPSQPAEGKLIATALERTGMSIREASAQAGISYGRWRQITSGYQNVSPGSYARVHGPAGTVARMAGVVKVTPGQLEDAGRPDAAEALRNLMALEPSHDETTVDDGVLSRDDLVEDAVRAAVEGYRAKVRARMAEINAERESNGRSA